MAGNPMNSITTALALNAYFARVGLFLGRLWRALKTILVLAIVVFFFGVLAETIVVGIPLALTEATIDERLAALTALFAFAALVLAVAGVLIAILAYSLSIQRPNLQLDWTLGDEPTFLDEKDLVDWTLGEDPRLFIRKDPERFVVVGVVQDRSGRFREIESRTHLGLTLICKNTVSAKNPAVRVTIIKGLTQFHGTRVVEGGWSLLEGEPRYARSVQWDGGANYLVHGRWSRVVPALPLGGSRLEDHADTATLQIQWVADGIQEQRRFITLHVLGPLSPSAATS